MLDLHFHSFNSFFAHVGSNPYRIFLFVLSPPPHPAMLGIEPMALFMLGKHYQLSHVPSSLKIHLKNRFGQNSFMLEIRCQVLTCSLTRRVFPALSGEGTYCLVIRTSKYQSEPGVKSAQVWASGPKECVAPAHSPEGLSWAWYPASPGSEQRSA